MTYVFKNPRALQRNVEYTEFDFDRTDDYAYFSHKFFEGMPNQ